MTLCNLWIRNSALRLGAIEEFAVDVIRSFTTVSERRKEHDHQYAFVHADVGLGRHELEIEVCTESKRALPGFLLQIRERFGSARRPVNQTIRPGAEDVDAEKFAVLFDHTLGYSGCVRIGVEPTASQFVSPQCSGCRIGQRRI